MDFRPASLYTSALENSQHPQAEAFYEYLHTTRYTISDFMFRNPCLFHGTR